MRFMHAHASLSPPVQCVRKGLRNGRAVVVRGHFMSRLPFTTANQANSPDKCPTCQNKD